jgi:flavin reductase (DIM6/NTAB) family NADH-FMN oxidoreductase RutF/pimeloyl-ACP methyl ester carboxylesterase
MRYVREFKGFAGIRLEADDIGSADDPSIVMLHGAGQTRAVWRDVAEELYQAGRHVINLDLRGHGGSDWPGDGRYDFDAYVEDLRAVLSQMRTRPVIVATTFGGWVATVALGADAATLAAGLVLVDLPTRFDADTWGRLRDRVGARAARTLGRAEFDTRLLDGFATPTMEQRLAEAVPNLSIPVLYVRGALSDIVSREEAERFAASLPNAEAVAVEDCGMLVEDERTEAFLGLLLDFLERRQPRAAPEFRSGSDARTLRDTMGCFATGVTIVTAHAADGTPVGLTANSFTSVSLDPPLLLVCVANSSSSAAVLRAADRFAVNLLHLGQQPTSNRFAGKVEDRFANTPWEVGEMGPPVLTGSLGAFECASESVQEAGDHFILIGRVLKATFEPRRDPLLYFRGKYRRLHFA